MDKDIFHIRHFSNKAFTVHYIISLDVTCTEWKVKWHGTVSQSSRQFITEQRTSLWLFTDVYCTGYFMWHCSWDFQKHFHCNFYLFIFLIHLKTLHILIDATPLCIKVYWGQWFGLCYKIKAWWEIKSIIGVSQPTISYIDECSSSAPNSTDRIIKPVFIQYYMLETDHFLWHTQTQKKSTFYWQ